MSVIVKDMEMPKTCHNCFCFEIVCGEIYCSALDSLRKDNAGVHKWYRKMRRDDCPLVEVPAHGRLIDADFEEAHYASMTINPTPDVTEQDKRSSIKIIQALKMAKTVIPAEGSES